ncbi:hypothetical protein NPIL_80871 [Nephila pilipes]|uniref:Uncharacterized protein n=1 Tax=Nephila pilipes TaxID=299642 RepID=A0A8X6IGY7_NEPPI|nr:hypothetical protein NPIL_80871 [Nephila pilipes]
MQTEKLPLTLMLNRNSRNDPLGFAHNARSPLNRSTLRTIPAGGQAPATGKKTSSKPDLPHVHHILPPFFLKRIRSLWGDVTGIAINRAV